MLKEKKRRTVLRIVVFAAAVITTRVVLLACGGGDDLSPYLRLFAPEVSRDTAYSPFFLSGYEFYNGKLKAADISTFDSLNVEEWSGLFGPTLAKKDIWSTLYKYSLGQIDTLIYKLKNPSYPADWEISNNTLLKQNDKKLVNDYLFYVGFAKRCQLYAAYQEPSWEEEYSSYTEYYKRTGTYDGWDEAWQNELKRRDVRSNTTDMARLIESGIKQAGNAKSGFIRERYIFQILRMYFHARRYNECSDYYSANMNKFTHSISIKYRAMAYAAGALRRQNKYAEANYLFSVVFDKYELLRLTAFRGFKPQEEADWNGALALAKSDREKAVLWQLLGIKNDAIRALKALYSFAPKSELMDALLVRYVNQREEEAWSPNWNGPRKSNANEPDGSAVKEEELAFIREAADKRNTNKPYLWELAAAHLSVIKHDFPGAKKYIAEAKKTKPADSIIICQIHMTEIICNLEAAVKIDAAFENTIMADLPVFEKIIRREGYFDNVANSWYRRRAADKYILQGDHLKAEMFDPGSDTVFNNSDKMKNIAALMDKPGKSAFEKFMISIYPYARWDVYDDWAVSLFFERNIPEALKKLEEGSQGMQERTDKERNYVSHYMPNELIPGDPFIIHINDCHDCDHADKNQNKYSKITFLKKMLELEKEAGKNSVIAADACFQLANAYYNTSYFGNWRNFSATAYGGNYIISFDELDREDKAPDTTSFYDCTIAGRYYLRAMQLSPDPEIKAMCCFMAAKCEQNYFYTHKPEDCKDDFRAGEYFKMLSEQFSGTKYYKEILKECGYFRTYAEGK